MSPLWPILVGSTAKLTVLIAFATLILAVRRFSSERRALIWAMVMAGTLLMPLLAIALPVWRPSSSAALAMIASVSSGRAVEPLARLHWSGFLLAIYVTGVILALLRIARAVDAARTLAIGSTLPDFEVPEAENVRVLIGEPAISPLTMGLLEPVIVLPQEAREWSPQRREVVMRHELAHARRGDWMFLILAQVAVALYWFNPLVWFAAAQLRKEQEHASDEAVLDAVPACDYADHLVGIAKGLSRPAPAGCIAATMIEHSELEDRIMHILTPRAERKPLSRLGRFATVLAAAAVILPLAIVIQPLTAMQRDHAYRIGNGVTAPKLLSKVEPKYTDEARDAKIEGTVVLSLVVSSTGDPLDIKVERGLDPGLDQKALDAIQQWKFQPGTKDGQAVDVIAQIEVNFRLK